MDYFAGLDVSVKATSVCIVDDTGKVVREVKVASEPEALLSVLKNPAYHFKRIGLEAGPLSQWLSSGLAEAELPVVCVETRHMQAVLKAQINKTTFASGEHDASLEARLLRQRDSFDESEVLQMTQQRRHSMPTQAPGMEAWGHKVRPQGVHLHHWAYAARVQGSRRRSGRGSATDKPQAPRLWRAVFPSREALCRGMAPQALRNSSPHRRNR